MTGASSALFSTNGTINDDDLNQASADVASCAANRMINDDVLK